jgi:DNA-binding response OmpR family regulator
MSFDFTRILIAEDHSVSRKLLEQILSDWGFQVATAVDGDSALEVLEGGDPPGLAIIDWMMPGVDGLEVCRRVRAATGRPFIYLILLTAKDRVEDVGAGLEAGANDYIVKPVDLSELRARLKLGQRVLELEQRLAAANAELESHRSRGS